MFSSILFNEERACELHLPKVILSRHTKPLLEVINVTESSIVAHLCLDGQISAYVEVQNQATLKTLVLPVSNPGTQLSFFLSNQVNKAGTTFLYILDFPREYKTNSANQIEFFFADDTIKNRVLILRNILNTIFAAYFITSLHKVSFVLLKTKII